MQYRVVSLERIDGNSLPLPVESGKARWRAIVDFWIEKAEGPPQISDDFVWECPTQRMRHKAGDEWELVEKHESLLLSLNEFIAERAPVYEAMIWAGRRGYVAAGEPAEQHGTIKPEDEIAGHADVRKILGEVKEVTRI